MANRRNRSRKSDDTWPGWVWMLFGLAIGLSVAAAIWFRDVPPRPVQEVAAPSPSEPVPATSVPALDNNREQADEEPLDDEEERFDFYEMLKRMEVVPENAVPSSTEDPEPQAVVEAGTYILQAGSFRRKEDAERRRAELGLRGIQSRVVRARPDGSTRFRVWIGPISDLDELNLVRRQLREARIDVLRITVD